MMMMMFNISIAQINMYEWSNALYNSAGNQHCPNQYFTIIVQQIKSSPMLVFDEKRKPEYPGKNLSE